MARPNINDIRADVDHLMRCDEDLLSLVEEEARSFTPDEQKKIDERAEKIADLQKEIRQMEIDESYRKTIAARKTSMEARQSSPIETTDGHLPADTKRPEIEFVRNGRLRAFTGPDAEYRAHKAGQWVLAQIFGRPKAQRWCRENNIYEEVRAMGEGVDTAGGFLVPSEFSQAIIDNRESYGALRRAMNITAMGRETMTIPSVSSGTTASFTAEAGTLAETTPVWGNVTLVAKDLDILTRYSAQVDDDAAISIADFLAMDFAKAFALKEDQCGLLGDGTSTYGGMTGIVTKIEAATSFASYVLAASGHDTFAEIDANDIAKLMGTLPEYAEPNAVFMCSRLFKEMVFGALLSSGGGNTMTDLNGQQVPAYLGYPIITSPVMPHVATTQNLKVACLFGDFNAAMKFGDRRGITIMRSDQAYFTTKQIGLRATERLDIVTHDIGDETNAGPVVGLVETTS